MLFRNSQLWESAARYAQELKTAYKMTFSNLVEHATKVGYRIDQEKKYHKLILEIDDKVEISLEFPNDDVQEMEYDSANIDWKYLITEKLTKKKIFSEWFDYYEGSKETKIQEMQQDILEYINNFSSQKFEIIEKPVFTLFGKGFLKYKELVFE